MVDLTGLLATVGIGTNPGGSRPTVIDALVRAIGAMRPWALALLLSRESSRFADDIVPTTQPAHVFSRVVGDPDDLTACFDASLQLIDELERLGLEPAGLAVDVTSGTVAMRVGAALAAVSRRVPRYRLIGGRRSGGLVEPGREEFLEFEPEAVFAEEDLNLASELIRRFRFGSARQVLARGQKARRGRSRQGAALLDKVARGYQAWDLFNHGAALKTLRQAAREGDLGEFALPGEKEGFLERLASGGRSPEGVADLVANARRRAEEERYDDAVGRLYRAMELTVQLALARRGLDSSDLDVRQLRDPQLRAVLEAETRPDWGGRPRVRIGLVKGLYVLRDQGDPLGELAEDPELRSALELRNQSILAHGLRPVDRAGFDRLQRLVLDAASILEAGIRDLVALAQFPWVGGREGEMSLRKVTLEP